MPPALYDWLTHGLSLASYWHMALWLLVVTQLTIFTVTLYYHRSQAHRGVDFHPALVHFFRFWGWLTTSMIVREWAAIHRKHHAKCETAEDPHSPQVLGINAVMWSGVELYRAARDDRDSIDKYGKGFTEDALDRHLYTRHATLGPVLMLVVSMAMFGVPGLVMWAVQMMWMPFWAAGVINGLGHWWGYRNFDTADAATNLVPWAFWIGGEELHNNHHAFPSSSKFALRKFEFDIGWSVICALEKFGLAKVLRVAPQLDVRPNIDVPDAETLRAIMAHRWQVATDYFSTVIKPQFKRDAKALPRRLRKAFRSDGRWLDEAHREKLRNFVATHPQLQTLIEYRQRLLAIYEIKSAEAEAKMDALRAWCNEAETSGIATLEEFSARLKGYALVPARI